MAAVGAWCSNRHDGAPAVLDGIRIHDDARGQHESYPLGEFLKSMQRLLIDQPEQVAASLDVADELQKFCRKDVNLRAGDHEYGNVIGYLRRDGKVASVFTLNPLLANCFPKSPRS